MTGDGGVEANSRLVVLGWRDPEVLKVGRLAPMPTMVGMAIVLHWIAGHKLGGYNSDFAANAFGQALPTTRQTRCLLIDLMATGKYQLRDEQADMASQKAARADGVSARCLKTSAASAARQMV